MVKGKVAEAFEQDKVDYRSIKGLNQSGLKIFDENPLFFYNEYILGIRKKRKESEALTIGSLTDFFTIDCQCDEDCFIQRLDEQFSLFEGNKSTAQVFALADILADLTERDTNDKGVLTTSFSSRFEEAFSLIQNPTNPKTKPRYSGKTLLQGLEDFEANGREYFEKKVESFSKITVVPKQLEIAKRVGLQLVTDPFTAWAYKDTEGIEVIKKLVIEWKWKLLNGEELDCKSELDIVHLDHYRKLIYIKDQKVTYDNENFEYTYINYKYYLQAAFYYIAALQWRDVNYPDYEVVKGMDFIVGDSSINGRRPLVYEISSNHLLEGLNGFTTRYGKECRGVGELMEEISFCIDNSSWNISKEAFENNGRIKLKGF